ncbi:MAG TPA: dephospho-CoA kinase [Polyangiaceae bacterium]|nr:dephospho-CoA kinase [Polyangiaceae bacterium]
MAVPVVGLTGGIASGKSTAARAFAERGVPVVDADQLAREVVAPGTDALTELVSAFGRDILLPDGSLDRKAVGARVFRDPALRQALNSITHPRIARLSAERLAQVDPAVPYAIYEAPLIVENGLHRAMRALIVVALDPQTQLQRAMHRDALDREEAERRMAAQAPLARKLEAADYVIDNNGDLRSLYARVDEIHHQLLDRLRGGPR